MNIGMMLLSHAHYVLVSLLFLFPIVLTSAQESIQNPECPSFMCGSLGEIGFPFSDIENPECGLCVLNCTGPIPQVQFHENGKWYNVEYFNNRLQTIRIYDQDVQSQLEDNRCDLLNSFTEQISPFFFLNILETLPFFKCKIENSTMSSSAFFNQFHNYTSCNSYVLYFYDDEKINLPSLPDALFNSCTEVYLPAASPREFGSGLAINSLTQLWEANFTLSWQILANCLNCHSSGGRCLSSGSGTTFECGSFKKGGNGGMKVVITALIIFGAILTVAMLISMYVLRNKAENLILRWKKKSETSLHFEAFIKTQGSLASKRYKFEEVKRMTDSFKNKLGQGGYGSVFKGTLNDGSLVAVKVLSETKGDGEEFINEVASISKTSHVNVVSLLGYCYEGLKRALIYEFMPNGSLEKFIYEEKRSESHLGWETFYQIAIGIARGLEYLHRGCNTRILHFDIKPHNILLDQDFCPKISDFGMAKLCLRKESIISILGTRGTAGYIAPEVFSRNFGGVSHKSDVYSYGMMILEMTGGRKNVNVGVSHSSEIYFPVWVYKRVELDEELGVYGVFSEAEGELTRKMILVGLWCIQTNPSDRPSMGRVLEMLEGSLEDLMIPPKPYLFSPARDPL